MDDFSGKISNFLDFLKYCEDLNRQATVMEIDMDNRTQDILHRMELAENSQYDYICMGFTLKDVRQKRRQAKDLKEITQLICKFSHDYKSPIQELKQLLGAVRKAENRTENRYYCDRTDVVKNILK